MSLINPKMDLLALDLHLLSNQPQEKEKIDEKKENLKNKNEDSNSSLRPFLRFFNVIFLLRSVASSPRHSRIFTRATVNFVLLNSITQPEVAGD